MHLKILWRKFWSFDSDLNVLTSCNGMPQETRMLNHWSNKHLNITYLWPLLIYLFRIFLYSITYIPVSKSGKIFTGPTYKLFLSFAVISNVYRSFISCKTTFTKYCLWNPLSKAVPSKFYGSGRHSKCNCLQDWANFHRSQAWQIVPILNTDIP